MIIIGVACLICGLGIAYVGLDVTIFGEDVRYWSKFLHACGALLGFHLFGLGLLILHAATKAGA